MSNDFVSWGEEIVTEVVRGIPFRTYADRPRHIAELLAFADRWESRPHLVQGDTIMSFAQLRAAVRAKAAELSALGVRAGDRVMLLGWNSPEWIVGFWGCASIGAVPVLANAWWGKSELVAAVEALTPVTTLADRRGSGNLPPGTATAPWTINLSANAAEQGGADVFDAVAEDSPAAIVFTSGTSGRPKAVVLSHRSLLAGLHMLLHITRRLPQMVDEGTGDAGLHTGPLFHIGGIQTLIRAITVGDTLVMPSGKFDPAEVLALIEEWKIARWSAVPTMVTRVLEHPDVNKRNVTSLKSLTVGGAPIHAEFIEQIRQGLPGVSPRVATGYGLTENGGQATAASSRDTEERPGTTGRPLPCVEAKILPPVGDHDGEVVLRAPTQMIGYFDDDESPIDSEGWLHTGDLGRVDHDGYLWITGRAKDLIIRGGENIAPAAVEEALGKLPIVVESAVFGVASQELGEEVMAVVFVNEDTTADELRAQLTPILSSFAIPSRWQIERNPLPTNHAGKIDMPAIKAAAIATLAASALRAGA